MTPTQVTKALEIALKDKQPSRYAQMRASGTLRQYLASLTASVTEQVQATHDSLANDQQFQKISDPLVKVQEANSRLKAATETALAQAIEQIDASESATTA